MVVSLQLPTEATRPLPNQSTSEGRVGELRTRTDSHNDTQEHRGDIHRRLQNTRGPGTGQAQGASRETLRLSKRDAVSIDPLML